MKNIFHLVWKKKWVSLLVLIILAGGGYWAYAKWHSSSVTVKYITAVAERGTLISSISGTGQVSAANQIDIKSKVAGDVLSVGNVIVGQDVKAGTLLFQLNARDALKTVRDAEVNLESANLSLKKLKQAADPLTLLQAENTLSQAQEAKQKATDNIEKAYEDAFNSISNAFLDLPTVISELDNVLYSKDIGESEISVGSGYWNIDALLNTVGNQDYVDGLKRFQTTATTDYDAARIKYDANFISYKTDTRYSDKATVEALLDQTIDTVKTIAQSAKSSSNYLDAWVDIRTKQSYKTYAKVTEYQGLLGTDIGKINGHLSTLISVQRTLQDNREAVVNADRTIAEKTESLANLKNGADPLDIEAQLISVKQKENSLADAREKLADYAIRAPFDGMIAGFSVKKGDTLSANTSVGALITKQQIATIALNEVDVAKVKVGQKVTLTFDAVEDLSITGDVAQVDAIGTVSQGVVSYNVKIVFNVQDERVKSGMTVTANIILSSKPDVLMVKTSAIKNQNGGSYVEVLVNGVPEKKNVVVGDSNDTMTEIISGISEGDNIVTQTISSNSTAAATTAAAANRTSGGGSFGGGAGGGDVMRALR